MSGKLTPKLALFAGEYLIDGNGARAARAVGVPAASAAVTAARWLRNANVAAAIEAGQARLAGRLEFTAQRVLDELAKVAGFDPAMLYDEDGIPIPVHRLDPHTRAAVASVEDETVAGAGLVTTRTQRLKLADKLRALEMLGRYHKMFTDKFEGGIGGLGGGPIEQEMTITFVRPG